MKSVAGCFLVTLVCVSAQNGFFSQMADTGIYPTRELFKMTSNFPGGGIAAEVVNRGLDGLQSTAGRLDQVFGKSRIFNQRLDQSKFLQVETSLGIVLKRKTQTISLYPLLDLLLFALFVLCMQLKCNKIRAIFV